MRNERLTRALVLGTLATTISGCAGFEGEVSMREFAQEDASVDAHGFRAAGIREADVDLEEEVEVELKSEVFCADDVPNCGCDVADTYISQVFVKSARDSANRIDGTLWKDGERTEGATLRFKKKTKVGIDLYYDDSSDAFPHDLSDSDASITVEDRTYHYVHMQDQKIFDDDHPFDPEVGLDVFEDGMNTYTFPIGEHTSDPGVSPYGCYMRVVADFL